MATLACGRATPGADAPPRAPRNVLLICVDTLRADRLGQGGHERDTSPALDALARRGARFSRAFSAYPQTGPSVASLFTSLAPSTHQKTSAPESGLTSSVASLAECFRRAGFRTAAVATNPHLSPGIGFEQGFEDYLYLAGERKFSLYERGLTFPGTRTEIRQGAGEFYGEGEAVAAAALEWLARGGAEPRPFFLYLHFMDVHNPYTSREPYQSMFVQERGHDRYCNGLPMKAVSARDLAYMSALYDGQIRYLDDVVASLLRELEARAQLAETLVVLVADHGDEFLEHGGLGHGETLFRELLHVPLVFSGPGIAAGVHDVPVSTLDLYPTLCALAGLPLPPHVQGESLAALIQGRDPAWRRSAPVVAECASTRMRADAEGARGRPKRTPYSPALSIVDGDWHLIHRPASATTELYDYRADPREQDDLAPAHAAEATRLLARAEEALARARDAGRAIQLPRTELDDSARAALDALGYGGEDEPADGR